ncbi:hypothetical protein ACN28I_04635 [Archangium gephyra]|uniref:hypothetical protein n=1 Tax=Archangium gephyra TaxID=48 RepID=UPI003B76B0D6
MLAPLTRPESALFWVAPLDQSTEFTPEDPLALDYLSQQVGLWLFANLTTRTSRAQNYAVVLYGLDLADKAITEYRLASDDETREKLFERWERFWALAVLESREGNLSRGDPDAMRGVLGAKRHWRKGTGPLGLDFKLISRQTELGSLGAYLSSLRAYRLVVPGTLRVSAAGRDIVEAFWDEAGNPRTGSYESYALRALDQKHPQIDRKHSGISLERVGERSRLTALGELGRRPQQARLWKALFEGAHDYTLTLAGFLRSASKAGVEEPREFLEAALQQRWGPVEPELHEQLEVALRFGDVRWELLSRFNAMYGHVWESGWKARRSDTVASAFPRAALASLQTACQALYDVAGKHRFQSLDVHGQPFLRLVDFLRTAGPSDAFEAIFRFHQDVQRSRRGGGSWIREEGDQLVMGLASYSGFRQEPDFPSFKFNVVRQLMRDLGKL